MWEITTALNVATAAVSRLRESDIALELFLTAGLVHNIWMPGALAVVQMKPLGCILNDK